MDSQSPTAGTDTLIVAYGVRDTEMRVRDWEDILQEVADTGEPEGWRAAVGDRRQGIGEDIYLGHPAAGLFQLKTYPKNPFEVRGVGAKVARRVDGHLDDVLPEEGNGRFALATPPEDESAAEQRAERVEEVVKAHADAPTSPADLFDDVMDATDSPAFGPMAGGDDRPEPVEELSATFEEAEALLEAEFEDLVAEDEVNRGIH